MLCRVLLFFDISMLCRNVLYRDCRSQNYQLKSKVPSNMSKARNLLKTSLELLTLRKLCALFFTINLFSCCSWEWCLHYFHYYMFFFATWNSNSCYIIFATLRVNLKCLIFSVYACVWYMFFLVFFRAVGKRKSNRPLIFRCLHI